jgi:hypothetical protein
MVQRPAWGDIFRRPTSFGPLSPGAAAFAMLSFAVLFLTLGCSSKKCGSSQACAAGTVCIETPDGGPACQQPCTGQAECPFNTYCNDGLANGQASNWCAPTTYPLAQLPGEWAASCKTGCDSADGFACYAPLPTDPDAFCTLNDCLYDSDCPGGWWCAEVNTAPNYTTTQRSFGTTTKWCLPRQYCSTCQMDHDCSKAADGTQQHCVQDSAGSGFCTPQCGSNASCPLDATCKLQWTVCAQATCKADTDCVVAAENCVAGSCQLKCEKDADCPSSNGAPQHCATGICETQACASDDDCPPTAGTFQHCNAGACTPECSTAAECNPKIGDQACVPLSVCVPRAGACVGNHGFCEPCLSDADCTDGYCVNAQYSTERFCSHAMAGSNVCSTTEPPATGSCPALPDGGPAKGFGCTTSADSALAPPNQCIGEVVLGATGQQMYVAGCWSVH